MSETIHKKVRCKMIVHELKQTIGYGGARPSEVVVLLPVSGKANATWSKWTPSGCIELQITNPDALEQFKLGEHFFVDFSPAPATEEEET